VIVAVELWPVIGARDEGRRARVRPMPDARSGHLLLLMKCGGSWGHRQCDGGWGEAARPSWDEEMMERGGPADA
jgi:hypothetical protein